MIGLSEKSGIEIESEYQLTGHPVIKVELVFSISNFLINKTFPENKWMRKKIPSCSNSALENRILMSYDSFL